MGCIITTLINLFIYSLIYSFIYLSIWPKTINTLFEWFVICRGKNRKYKMSLFFQIQEKNSIWVPSVTFLNTASQDFTLNDISSYVKVLRKSNLTQVSDVSHENAYVYDGDSNHLVLGRVYQTSWICQYDTLWYPFDTQVLKYSQNQKIGRRLQNEVMTLKSPMSMRHSNCAV